MVGTKPTVCFLSNASCLQARTSLRLWRIGNPALGSSERDFEEELNPRLELLASQGRNREVMPNCPRRVDVRSSGTISLLMVNKAYKGNKTIHHHGSKLGCLVGKEVKSSVTMGIYRLSTWSSLPGSVPYECEGINPWRSFSGISLITEKKSIYIRKT